MKHKKSLALILAIFTLLSVILCCPITASARGEKHNPYYYSTSAPTRALYYKSSGVMKGADVKWLQAALNVLNNANLDIDGSFGQGTRTAVRNFQSKNGLGVDGSCGNATRSKIISLLYNKGYIAPGKYVIETKLTSNSAVDLSGNNTANGTNIHLYQKNGSTAQIFNVAVNGKYGWYSIRHASSGKSIDVAGGSSRSGTNVQLYQWNGSAAQDWCFSNAGNGYFYFYNRLGCYLDVSGGRTANGTNIQVYSFNGTNSQKWKFVPTSGATSTSNEWLWPSNSKRITCGFADNVYHTSHWHRGIDIPCDNKSDVYASRAGTVACVNHDSSRGNYLVIDHGDGYYSEYQHLYSVSKSKGSKVSQGDVIAKSGNTGSGGYHLHFEIWYLGSSGKSINNAEVPWDNYNQYINVNPKNSNTIYCTKSNDKDAGLKIGQKQDGNIRKAALTKTSVSAGTNGTVYCYDSNGIYYIFK